MCLGLLKVFLDSLSSFMSRLKFGHLGAIAFDICSPECGTSWKEVTLELDSENLERFKWKGSEWGNDIRLVGQLVEIGRKMVNLPAFVKLKKIETTGMSSRRVATTPKL